MIGYLYETVGYSLNHFILRNKTVNNVARCHHHCCLHCFLVTMTAMTTAGYYHDLTKQL